MITEQERQLVAQLERDILFSKSELQSLYSEHANNLILSMDGDPEMLLDAYHERCSTPIMEQHRDKVIYHREISNRRHYRKSDSAHRRDYGLIQDKIEDERKYRSRLLKSIGTEIMLLERSINEKELRHHDIVTRLNNRQQEYLLLQQNEQRNDKLQQHIADNSVSRDDMANNNPVNNNAETDDEVGWNVTNPFFRNGISLKHQILLAIVSGLIVAIFIAPVLQLSCKLVLKRCPSYKDAFSAMFWGLMIATAINTILGYFIPEILSAYQSDPEIVAALDCLFSPILKGIAGFIAVAIYYSVVLSDESIGKIGIIKAAFVFITQMIITFIIMTAICYLLKLFIQT